MSTKVLVIPEDPQQNGYILQPLVERLLEEAGKSRAAVTVLSNPRVRGYADACTKLRSEELRGKYGRTHPLWLFLPDEDAIDEEGRGARGAELKRLEGDVAGQGVTLFCCAARPELEAWLLAGHVERLPLPWREVRDHPRLKEGVFDPFIAQCGKWQQPGRGRRELMREALKEFRGLLSRCDELGRLFERLRAHFAAPR